MKWYVRETTYWDPEVEGEPADWSYLGDFPSVKEAIQHLWLEAPVCLTDSSNPYGGAYVDWHRLNLYLGLPIDDTSEPADVKYDQLHDVDHANVLVYELAAESVLAPAIIQGASRDREAPSNQKP